MDALKKVNDAVAKAQRDAAILTALAPHIPGDPKLFYASGIWGAVATVSYKLRTIAELQALIAALPPVESTKYKGTFAGVKPSDKVTDRDATIDKRENADGVTFEISAGNCVGLYPCDQHAMSAQWYTDTPAGRLAVRVDFNHNTRKDWPTIGIRYEYETVRRSNGTYEERAGKRIRSIFLNVQLPHSECLQFSSGDAKEPGTFTLWFRDAESRDLSLECIL